LQVEDNIQSIINSLDQQAAKTHKMWGYITKDEDGNVFIGAASKEDVRDAWEQCELEPAKLFTFDLCGDVLALFTEGPNFSGEDVRADER